MASCGADLFDEKKEVDVNEGYSLNNIVAFSSKRKQMSLPALEGLLTSDDDGRLVDRRTKVLYRDSDFCYASYYMLSQMTAKLLNDGKKAVGSGAEVIKKGKGRWLLTCAHNLVEYGGRTNRVVPYTDFYIYKARQGVKTWTARYRGDDKNIRVHPKYNGNPDCGFDIGLISIMKTISQPELLKTSVWGYDNLNSDLYQDVICYHVNPDQIKKGMIVELAGFPGEKRGWPHTQRGKVVDVTKTELGGHMLWYDVDATPGNSGSCLMIIDKDYVKSVHPNGKIKKVVVGVHAGHCAAENLNYGTLITPSIGEWIDKC